MKNCAYSLSALVVASLLTACGGGGGTDSPTSPTNPTTPTNPPTNPTPSTGLQMTVPPSTYATASGEARVFELVNAERARCGFGLVAQNAKLDEAAAMHGNYLKLRFNEGVMAGHDEEASKSGYYATTGAERAAKAGYVGTSAGDYLSFYNIGSTSDYGNSLVRAMMATVYHQVGMLDGNKDVGVSVVMADQAPSGFKLASLVWQPGTATGAAQQQTTELVSYPCQGSAGLQPYMFGEAPDPFAGLGFKADTGIGHPIYFRAPGTKEIKLSLAAITGPAGKSVPVTLYHASNDANKMLKSNQAFIIPREPLAEGTLYQVQAQGTIDGVAFSRDFTFSTRTFN